jgi:hypothetical protein
LVVFREDIGFNLQLLLGMGMEMGMGMRMILVLLIRVGTTAVDAHDRRASKDYRQSRESYEESL